MEELDICESAALMGDDAAEDDAREGDAGCGKWFEWEVVLTYGGFVVCYPLACCHGEEAFCFVGEFSETDKGFFDAGIDFLELGDDVMAKVIPAVGGVLITWIFDPLELVFFGVGKYIFLGYGEQRAVDVVVGLVHTAKARESCTTDGIEENSFCLVTGVVGGEYEMYAKCAREGIEIGVACGAEGGFGGELLSGATDVEGEMVFLCELSDKHFGVCGMRCAVVEVGYVERGIGVGDGVKIGTKFLCGFLCADIEQYCAIYAAADG